jgi:putative zinc finger protein
MNLMEIRRGKLLFLRGRNEVLPMQISCREVRRELANYMEDDDPQELKVRIEQHFLTCEGCLATYDSLRKIIRLMDGAEIIELPEGFSARLYHRIATGSDSEPRNTR